MERTIPCLGPGIGVDANPSDVLCTIHSLWPSILRTAVEYSWCEGSLICDTAFESSTLWLTSLLCLSLICPCYS